MSKLIEAQLLIKTLQNDYKHLPWYKLLFFPGWRPWPFSSRGLAKELNKLKPIENSDNVFDLCQVIYEHRPHKWLSFSCIRQFCNSWLYALARELSFPFYHNDDPCVQHAPLNQLKKEIFAQSLRHNKPLLIANIVELLWSLNESLCNTNNFKALVKMKNPDSFHAWLSRLVDRGLKPGEERFRDCFRGNLAEYYFNKLLTYEGEWETFDNEKYFSLIGLKIQEVLNTSNQRIKIKEQLIGGNLNKKQDNTKNKTFQKEESLTSLSIKM